MGRAYKELDAQYKQWLQEDVVYIISPEERTAFLQLSTSEEREQFIEQFWLRRSSNPDLPENDFKEEHYRRIAYANEHFASGIPGWRTDRGRIYIIWGPADEVESHPTGGTYDRPMDEGGGSTTTYPWETWRYRYLEGLGNNVILEFVDPSGSGEYHLTMDPSEKDALLHVPGAGLSNCDTHYRDVQRQAPGRCNATSYSDCSEVGITAIITQRHEHRMRQSAHQLVRIF